MATEETPLLVADSWLVLDGAVLSLDRHVSRFSQSCLEIGAVTQADLDRFWCEATSALPRTGAWFPRVELAGDPPSPVDPPSGCPFHPRCPERSRVAGDWCRLRAPGLEPAGAARLDACHLERT